jgi:hypothetical protein
LPQQCVQEHPTRAPAAPIEAAPGFILLRGKTGALEHAATMIQNRAFKRRWPHAWHRYMGGNI